MGGSFCGAHGSDVHSILPYIAFAGLIPASFTGALWYVSNAFNVLSRAKRALPFSHRSQLLRYFDDKCELLAERLNIQELMNSWNLALEY